MTPSRYSLLAIAAGALLLGSAIAAAQTAPAHAATASEYMALGVERLQAGEIEQAIEAFYEALKVDLEYAHAYTQLSNAFRAQAPWDGLDRYQVDMAISFGEKAVFLAPDDSDAHMALANAYYWKRWYRQAHQHFVRADELNPTAETALEIGFMHVEMGNLDKALAAYERSFAFDTTSISHLVFMATPHRVLGNFEVARGLLQRPLEMGPTHRAIHQELALSELAQQRSDEAIRRIEALLDEEHPEYVRLVALAGYLHWYAGNDAQATEYLERVIELPDQDPLTGWWGTYSSTPLAHIYLRQGDAAQAAPLIESSLRGYMGRFREAAEGWGYMYDLARIYAMQDERDRALKWLRQAIDYGFSDFALAGLDPAMADLHDDPEYRRIMGDLAARVEEMRARVVDR